MSSAGSGYSSSRSDRSSVVRPGIRFLMKARNSSLVEMSPGE